jgi:transcription termination factor NusB
LWITFLTSSNTDGFENSFKTLKKGWNPDALPLIDRQITRLESLMLQLHKDETPEEIIAIQLENWDFLFRILPSPIRR